MTKKTKEKIEGMTELEKINLFKKMQEEILILKEEIYQFRKFAIKTQSDAVRYFRTVAPIDRETVYVLFLDAKAKVIDFKHMGDGTLTQALMYPREIMKHAIAVGAFSMVIMHNHPSGDYSPSDNDKKITKKLLFASKEMDMTVLDHIITGSNEKYYSFYEQGLIDRYNGEYRTAFESFNV